MKKIDHTEIFTHELETTAELLMREHNRIIFVWDKNLNSSDCWQVLTDSEQTDTELDMQMLERMKNLK